MARIRTIKPEFCTSPQVAECSPTARLLFVEMWCFCDDAGRHLADLRRLKMECFPGDPFDLAYMGELIGELKAQGLIVEYEYQGQRFWQVTGWKHQKIDKPSYKHGPLDKAGLPLAIGDEVANGSRPVDECSASSRRTIDDSSPPEGNGMESKGMEDSSPSTCVDGGGDFQSSQSKQVTQASSLATRKASSLRYDDADYQVAEFMLEKVKEAVPCEVKADLRRWANTIRLMRERDNRSLEQIRSTFVWANSDEFWRANILCPGKLREKFVDLVAKQVRKKVPISAPAKASQIPRHIREAEQFERDRRTSMQPAEASA